jgi:hypothetical protein
MKLNHGMPISLAATALLASSVLAAQTASRTWTFDDDPTGQIARSFTNEVGDRKVVPSDQGKALAQTAKNADDFCNVTLASDTSAKDLDLSVRLKAIAGKTDPGGGLVWRAKDARNYYLARYNPLDDNFRVYKVVAGKRAQFRNADIPHTAGLHTLRVVMEGITSSATTMARSTSNSMTRTGRSPTPARLVSGRRPTLNRSSTT